MPARPYRRKDLKEDEFVSLASRATRWLLQHRRRIGWAVLVAVLGLSVLVGVRLYQNRRDRRAAAMLTVALEIYRSPVTPEEAEAGSSGLTEGGGDPGLPGAAGADGQEAADAGTDEGSGVASEVAAADEHGPVGHRHFRSEEARAKAAVEALAPILEEYGGTPSGRLAAFYLGLSHSQLGDLEAAEEALRRAAAASSRLVAELALYRLGLLRLQDGRAPDAAATFDELLSKGPRFFPKEEALMAKARALETAGDRPGALQTYRRILEEHPASFAAAEAQARADELAAVLGEARTGNGL